MFFVILDTNVFTADWTLKSVAARACLDMCKKTGSRFLMPRIILEELEKQYEDKLSKQIVDYNQQAHNFSRFFDTDKVKPLSEINVKVESEKYIRNLLRKLRIRRKDILDYPPDVLPKLVHNAIHRIKPFTDRGEEFRDVLLWETVKANLCPDGVATTVFISQDSSAFIDKNDPSRPLHPILLEEIEVQRLNNEAARQGDWFGVDPYFEFYSSLKAFVHQHYKHIEHINIQWFESLVSKERLKVILNNFQKYKMPGLTDVAIKLVKSAYGREVLEFAIKDSWLIMNQYACDFEDFIVYDFSQDNYGLMLKTSGKLILVVKGQNDNFNNSQFASFFWVGYNVEFGLGIKIDSEGKYEVDYSEFPSFEPDTNYPKRVKQEGLPMSPSADTINQALNNYLDIFIREVVG